MLRHVWRDELDSHLLDCADDLVKLGYDQAAATAEAETKFGDRSQIEHDLQLIHPWLAAGADWIVLGLLVFTLLPLYLIYFFSAVPTLVIASEHLLLWWYGGAFIVGTLTLLHWQFSIIPLTKRLSLRIALAMGWLVATCITVALDMNNFETIIYNALFALIGLLLLELLWKPLGLWYRQWFIYLVVSAMLMFAWREAGLFESSLFQHCLYVVDNNPYAVPSPTCQYVSPWSGYFWFIYAALTVSISYSLYYLKQLWQRGTVLHRQLVTTGVFIVLPIVAVSISGVNSTGSLDVVEWKDEIYQAYIDVLGRRPEDKDYQFYGTTRSYLHMSEVRAVLYQSAERRDKIKLLYEDILQREPTAEELDHYADSKLTINQILDELKQQ